MNENMYGLFPGYLETTEEDSEEMSNHLEIIKSKQHASKLYLDIEFFFEIYTASVDPDLKCVNMLALFSATFQFWAEIFDQSNITFFSA